jgi:serpin B
MKKVLLAILAVITLLTVSACTSTATAAELKSNKPHDTAPAVNHANATTLANDNAAFALGLYLQLIKAGGNIFYSPYSLSEVLAMTYGGARGDTAAQMASTLHYTLAQDTLHPAFNSVDIALASRSNGKEGKDAKGFRLNVANAIWGQKDFKFTQSYLDLLAQNYGAGLRVLDFMNAPEGCRQTINNWVSDRTENKIKDLLAQGSVTPDTRLVLTNAIYFNAAWAYKFDKNSTHDGQFHLSDGSAITTSMMTQEHSYNYTEGTNYQVVELPYDGYQLSMVAILPASGQFSQFESSLTSQQLNNIIAKMQNSKIDLTMPKFTVESSFGLVSTLGTLGMKDAFNPAKADFSGMDGAKDLFIGNVVHKAYVSVNEDGTEAAAASAVIMMAGAAPGESVKPIVMTIDRPFIFLIRDIPTNTILFIGRVMNPAPKA